MTRRARRLFGAINRSLVEPLSGNARGFDLVFVAVATVLLASLAVQHPASLDARAALNESPSIQAASSGRSLALPPAANELQVKRRSAPSTPVPLAEDSCLLTICSRKGLELPADNVVRGVVGALSSGYDATAPPRLPT